MDDDSCSKFIGSLTKYLQSLCHSYVEFNTGVELAGHIYLNVDTGKKIDYVLNESVCKNGANVVKFTSNSYHAQPVEKKDKKDTPKKDGKSDSGRPRRDDDDVIIVGSEGSRRNRTPGSSPRGHMSPQMQRGMGMNRMGQGMFRSPRGMSPRFGGPVPRAGGYTYQPRQRLTYTQQPRNYLAGYSPRMRQPYQPRASQMPVRPPNTGNAVDTDVAYMREEYVAGQTPTTTANQSGFQGQYTGGQQQPGAQGQAGQQFGAPTGQTPSMAGQAGSTAASGQEGVLPTAPSTDTNLFQQSAPSVSGGMPLPVTTHTIFDSGPVMAPMDLPTTQPIGDGASTSAASDPLAAAMSSAGVTSDSTAPVSTSAGGDSQNLLIGKVWSDTNHDPTTQTAPAQSSSTGAPGETTPTLSTDYLGQSGSGFDLFNQSVTQTSGTSQTSQSLPSTSFPPSLNPAGSSEGDGFSALVSELQAFNQQAGAPPLSSQSHPSTTPTTTNTYPNTSSSSNVADRPSYGVSKTGERVLIKRDPGVKRDPDISANIASSVLQEEAANQSDRFSSPGSGTMDSYRKRGESAPTQASTSPGSAGLVGPESVVIETKPFLRHATDFDSSCDPASSNASNSQGQQSHGPSTPHTPRPATTTPTTPPTPSTPTLPVVNVKKERKDEDEVAESTVKHAQSEWQNKGKESDWVTDMSALNNSDSMDSDSDTAQDDDDPNYTPGRPIEGSRKRTPRKTPGIPKGPPKSPASTSAASPETQKQQVTPQKAPQAPMPDDNVVNILDSDEEEECGTKSLPLPPNIVIKQEKPDEVVVKKEPIDPDEQAMMAMMARKSSAKRPLPKSSDKGFKGKRRKTNPDSEGEEDHPPLPGDMGDEDSGPPLPVLPPSLDSDQHMGGSYEEAYKPGTFVLVNMSKDSDRPSRMRATHNTPAEVIVPPLGQDGVWVHILVSAGGGLWRLPNADQLVDVRLETHDIVKSLDKSHVNIVGSKVFYKFDDIEAT